MAWVLDLDGVVWRGDRIIEGGAEAVEILMGRGEDVGFVTNNSYEPVAACERRLEACGIAAAGRVITSAQVAATLVHPGERVLVCAGTGVREALHDRDVEIVDEGDADVVLVGYDPHFDYGRMAAASRAVDRGARLLATNDDPTYPAPDGAIPGCGAILASIVTATGVAPEVAGKPYAPMVAFVAERFGPDGVVVGDRPSTDGLLASRLGWRFGLVLSGVTTAADLPVQPTPALVADDLRGLVERWEVSAP